MKTYVAVSILALLVSVAYGSNAGTLGQNLLTNGGGELDAAVTGWTPYYNSANRPVQVAGSAYPTIGTVEGQAMISPGDDKWVYQDVDISMYRPNQVMVFSGYIATVHNEREKGQIRLELLDAAGASVHFVDSLIFPTQVNQANAELWYNFVTKITKSTTNAVTLRVHLIATDATGFVEVFFDGLSLAANLINNPSAEFAAAGSNVPLHWTATTFDGVTPIEDWSVESYYHTGPAAANHGQNFFAPPIRVAEAMLSQVVDVSTFATGTVFFAEAYMTAGYETPQSDTTALTVTWLDSNGIALNTPTPTFYDHIRAIWSPKYQLVTKPASAVSARISLLASLTTEDNDVLNNGYFDTLFFGTADHAAQFSTATLDFVEVSTRCCNTREVNVTNLGVFTDLIITSSFIDQTLSKFTLSGGSNTIQPGETATFIVTADNGGISTFSGTLRYTLIDPATPSWNIPLSATVIDRLVDDLQGNSHDFGRIYQNNIQSKQFQLQSVGTEAITLNGISDTFAGTGFTFTSGHNTFPRVLNPANIHSIQVQFNPNTVIGANDATFTVTTNDLSRPTIVYTLSAIADNYAIALNTTTLDFDQVHITQTMGTMPVEVMNSGQSGDLVISQIAVEGSQGIQYTQSEPNTGFTLAPGESRVVTISFNPRNALGQAVGASNGEVRFTSNDPQQGTISVYMQAMGGDWEARMLQTNGLTFADRHMNASGISNGQTAQIFNAGTFGNLRISGYKFQDIRGGSSSFALTDPSSFSYTEIGAGGSYGVSVGYTPSSGYSGVGERNATFHYITNDVYNPEPNISVGAIALDFTASIAPATTIYGEWHIGAGASPARLLNLTNIGTLGNLAVSNVFIVEASGTNPGEFFFQSGAPGNLELAPGESYSFDLPFDPQSTGEKSSHGTIATNDPNYLTISGLLEGIGTNQQFVLNEPLTFAHSAGTRDIRAGPSSTFPVTISNGGTDGNLALTSVSITSGYSSDWIIEGDTSPVPPGAIRLLTVRFNATAIGNRGSTLTIETDDPAAPITSIALNGEGMYPVITINRERIDMGRWDVANGYRTLGGLYYEEIVVTSAGTTDLIITGLGFPVNPSTSFSTQDLATSSSPLTIAAGQSYAIKVLWDPNTNGYQEGVFTITSNDYDMPATNVPVTGQAIQALADGLSDKGNVSFYPPYGGAPSVVRFFTYTSDAGLPMNGKLQISFPANFDVSSASASVNGVQIPRSMITIINGNTTYIDLQGSGLGSIENGAYIYAEIYNVILPSFTQCETDFMNWVWTAFTFDAAGGQVEHLLSENLPGDFCLEPKTYELTTTPLAAPTIIAGMHIKFNVSIGSPAVVMAAGLPLLDTNKGGDSVKVIDAFINGVVQGCSEAAMPTGAVVTTSDDLGIANEMNALNSIFNTAFSAGTYRLCYLQPTSPYGWEQVGDTIMVAPKPGPDGGVFPAYTRYGVQEPTVVSSPAWRSYGPNTAIVGEQVEYSFTGAYFNGAMNWMAKVSYWDEDCNGQATGVMAEGLPINSQGMVTFTVNDPGHYKMCIKYRKDWEEMDGWLWVRTEVDTNQDTEILDAFNGYQSCDSYVQGMTSEAHCGCFYGNGTSEFVADASKPVSEMLSFVTPDMTINQGCCAMNAVRMEVKSTFPQWGYCK